VIECTAADSQYVSGGSSRKGTLHFGTIQSPVRSIVRATSAKSGSSVFQKSRRQQFQAKSRPKARTKQATTTLRTGAASRGGAFAGAATSGAGLATEDASGGVGSVGSEDIDRGEARRSTGKDQEM
jgi:hypothetical protein